LLCRHGNAKIADLGLAKIVAHGTSAVTGNLGTLSWVRGPAAVLKGVG
jgi:hypothetical protein